MRYVLDDLRCQNHIVGFEIGAIRYNVHRPRFKPKMGKQLARMLDNTGNRLDPFAGPVHSRQIRQPASSTPNIQDT